MAFNLRAIRKLRKMTQEDLAGKMNRTQQNISAWERSKGVDSEILEELCKVLSCNSHDLLGI